MSSMDNDAASASDRKPFYGKPFMWLLFALVLVILPVSGYMLQAGMSWNEAHPAVNAMLNGASSVFLIAGFFAIRGRDVAFHRSCMVAAFVASSVFLASYLTR